MINQNKRSELEKAWELYCRLIRRKEKIIKIFGKCIKKSR